MKNNNNNLLNELVKSFSELKYDEQVNEIENKIKALIAVFNELNDDKELSLVSSKNIVNDSDLTEIFNLLCCLEEEVAKLLLEKISLE